MCLLWQKGEIISTIVTKEDFLFLFNLIAVDKKTGKRYKYGRLCVRNDGTTITEYTVKSRIESLEEYIGEYELIKDGKLLRIQEVAARVNLTQAWIYELIKKGKFPAGEKYGVARLWTGDEVNEWLENREAKRG